jgi:hypothetical protein
VRQSWASGVWRSPRPGPTSVPAGTPLGQLSAGQLATLCSDIGKFFNDRTNNPAHYQAECKYAGFRSAALSVGSTGARTNAELQMRCAALRDECLAAPVDNILLGTCAAAPPADCTSTVGQYATCLADDNRILDAAFAAATECSAITAAGLAANGDDAPEAASCTMLAPSCAVEVTRREAPPLHLATLYSP